ncbi:hypothetical protein ES288_D06G181700v1 [Gossypium darwinii]|uniref:Cytochrome c-553 n=1 Tax=Gossypium darwinii TaxID=34276 RepID=A0A5D2C710_GOSDA|nr:hypothetical protein ES288_D06G181700v1 [Gossypium darwinii]
MEILSAVSPCSYVPRCLLVKGNANQAPSKLKHVEQVKRPHFKNMFPPLVAAFVALSPICNTPAIAQSVDIQRGATLFGQACIGCHDGGGNIIQPGATLFTKDLERNGVVTEDDIYRITYYGKGRMPGFGESCTPRGQCTFGPRLKEDEIKLLAEFVKLQADQGWPNVASNGD